MIDKMRNLLIAISFNASHEISFTTSIQPSSNSTKRETLGEDYDWQPKAPIPAGNYRITLHANELQRLGSERFFVKNGFGNWETLYVQFSKDHTNRYSADLALKNGAKLLRFSPRFPMVRCPVGTLLRVGCVAPYLTQLRKILSETYANRPELLLIAKQAFRLLRKYGLRGFMHRALYPRGTYRDNYEGWIATNETRSRLTEIPQDSPKPLLSILLPLCDPSIEDFTNTIDSVLEQDHENWELCIVGACSLETYVRDMLDDYSHRDRRIKVKFLTERTGAANVRNIAFHLASGTWCTVVNQNAILHHRAIAEVTSTILDSPTAEVIYSDEDQIDALGKRHDPYFKSEYSLLLLQTHNFLGQLTFYRSSTVTEIGGWREIGGSEDYDLALRVIERLSPRHIRHIPKILYHSRGEAFSANGENALAALSEHLDRLSLPAQISSAPETPCFRIRYEIPQPAPRVSLIIPTRDRVHLLRAAVESILEKTTYSNYEIIIVDNDSKDVETHEYFDFLRYHKNIHIHTYCGPFNYSALNNFAVAKCSGSIIGLINNDVEIISPDWLSEMVAWAAQPRVGCVGAKLYYENGTIQHAGILLGIGDVAGHAHKHFPGQHPGYFYRLKINQSFSAVTGACLLIKKSIYQEVGGLDEEHLPVAFNDVDLCLKTIEAGYHNVWTPYAELFHYESVSRGKENDPEKKARYSRESLYMQRKWDLRIDPYYSPNLTRTSEDFSLK